jgi:hypothetical protein
MSIFALMNKTVLEKTTTGYKKGETHNWQLPSCTLVGPKGTLMDPSYRKMSLAT